MFEQLDNNGFKDSLTSREAAHSSYKEELSKGAGEEVVNGTCVEKKQTKTTKTAREPMEKMQNRKSAEW